MPPLLTLPRQRASARLLAAPAAGAAPVAAAAAGRLRPHQRLPAAPSPLCWLGRPTATNGSTPAARAATSLRESLPHGRLEGGLPCPGLALPQPVFPARRRLLPSGWAGAVKAASLRAPAGLGLDSRSPPGRYTLMPPGRAGFWSSGSSWGRTGAPAPRAADGSRGTRLKASTATSGVGRGQRLRWAPAAAGGRRAAAEARGGCPTATPGGRASLGTASTARQGAGSRMRPG